MWYKPVWFRNGYFTRRKNFRTRFESHDRTGIVVHAFERWVTRVEKYAVGAAGSVACTQTIFGRRTRTLRPAANKLLDTPTSNGTSAAPQDAKARRAEYYTVDQRNARRWPSDKSYGWNITTGTPERRKAELVEVLPHRSHQIRFADEPPVDGRRVVCVSQTNRAWLWRTTTEDEGHGQTTINSTAGPPSHRRTTNGSSRGATTVTPSIPHLRLRRKSYMTRSGRVVRRPAKYDDKQFQFKDNIMNIIRDCGYDLFFCVNLN